MAKELPLHGTRVGAVERIHVILETGGDPDPRESVDAVADRGIEGDRYYRGEGLYNERDALDARIVESATVTVGDEIV